MPDRKTWWRNIEVDSTVRLGGREIDGLAALLSTDDPEGQVAMNAYRRRFPRADPKNGPVVLIHPDRSTSAFLWPADPV